MAERHRPPETAETPREPQEGTFLRRWARRKGEASGRGSEGAGLPDAGAALPSSPAPEAASTAKTDADMPPLDSLDEKSDFSAFFSRGVSEELRRLALRKLFHGETFQATDGLDDYADDYRRFAALGEVVTADLRYQRERLAARLDSVLERAAADAPEPQDERSAPKPSAEVAAKRGEDDAQSGQG
jgi:hypothetical protein